MRTPRLLVAAFACLTTSTLAPAASGSAAKAAKVPGFFVANAGQARADVRFQASVGGRVLWFTDREVFWAAREAANDGGRAAPAGARKLTAGASSGGGVSTGSIAFEGARLPEAAIEGLEPLRARVNFFRGADPSRWRVRVPAYGALVYRGLYPGIDLRFENRSGAIRSTFTVAPGADPARISWRPRGASRLEPAPVPASWQQGPERDAAVPVRRVLRTDGSVGLAFPLGYDPSRELTIDARIFDATYLGGSGDDIAYDVAADSEGAAYVTGSTLSTDFPTAGPIDSDCGTDGACDAGKSDAFVAKIDPSQTGIDSLVYATYLGGSGDDVGVRIAVDTSGGAYVGGIARADFPTTGNAYQGAFAAGTGADGFLARLSEDGASLVYATYLGGTGGDGVWAVAADDSGSAWVAGQTFSSDFPSTDGASDDSCGSDGACNGASDAFVAKLDTTKSGADSLVFSTFLGGSGDDQGFGVARGASGTIAVTGRTTSADFPGAGGFQGSPGGGYDAFVAVLDAAGANLVYATYLGGGGYDDGYGIVSDPAGRLLVVGTTGSADLPTTSGAPQKNFGGVFDAYFARVDPGKVGAASLVTLTYLGGSNDDEGYGLALDDRGFAHVTGFTFSADFPSPTCPLPGAPGTYDAFLARFRPDASGNPTLAFASSLGGGGTDAAYGVAIDPSHRIFVAGQTSSTDFPLANAADDTLGGTTDAFLAEIELTLPAPAAITPRSGPAAGGTAVAIAGTEFPAGAAVTIGAAEATGVAVAGDTEITASTPALSPGTLNEVRVTNADGCAGFLARAWLADFVDVPQAHLFHGPIEKIFRAGITAGCGSGAFCPDTAVSRDQMAIFLIRGKHGSAYAPPPATGTLFGDVPAGAFGAAFIEQLAAEDITTGCGAGNYCPSAPVNRASMAVMLLRARHGGAYKPPAAAGTFSDVPASDPFARWIEELSHEGITTGCGGGRFCPDAMATRGEMAAFLARTFTLP